LRAAVAVLCDGTPDVQRRRIDALKLDHFIHRVVLTEEQGSRFRKPHPQPFVELQRWMGLPSHKCLYVGDDPRRDFHAPRQLGWHCLRIRRREGMHAAAEVPESVGMIPYCRDLGNFLEFVMFQNPEASIGT
jgi:putative hydrolase of the HAD superfamily